jgi:hypothetical protein
MIKQNLAVLLLSTLTLTACAKTTNATLTPEVQEKVNKLLEKTGFVAQSQGKQGRNQTYSDTAINAA